MPKVPYCVTFPTFNPAKVEGYVDWRLKKNRKEAVSKVTNFRYITGDLDHTQFGLAVAAVEQFDNEQKAWFSVLFGQSYRAQNAAIVMQVFPKIWETPSSKILRWMEKETGLKDGPKLNGNRLIYGNDTKWNRWKLHKSVESIQLWLRGDSLYERLKELCTEDTDTNRQRLEAAVGSWQQYGWMSTWLTIQMLWDFFKWDVDNWKFPFPQNWSSYNGIMYVYGQEGKIATKNYQPSKEDVALAQSYIFDLRDYLTNELPYTPDSFSIESVLCEYRKTAFGPKIKEYTGWTSSELALQYPTWKQWWSNTDVDMTSILTGMMARHPLVRAVDYDKRYFKITHETGMLQNMHTLYEGMPNVYSVLSLPSPLTMRLSELEKDWSSVSKRVRNLVYNELHPCNKLRGSVVACKRVFDKITTNSESDHA